MPQARCGGKRTPYSSSVVASAITPAWSRGFVPMCQTWRGFLGWGEVFFEPPRGSGGAAVTPQPPSKRLPCSRDTSCREATSPERQGGFPNPLFAPSHPQKQSEFASLCPAFSRRGVCVGWGVPTTCSVAAFLGASPAAHSLSPRASSLGGVSREHAVPKARGQGAWPSHLWAT